MHEEETPTLLFVDILGTKSVWKEGGREGAAALFERFARLIDDEVSRDPERVTSGGVESDCVALICPSAGDAVSVGIGLYERAFFDGPTPRTSEARIWLRGVVVPLEGPAGIEWLRTASPLSTHSPNIRRERYSGDLLDAIAMEKAGFRGMRLLADSSLVTPSVKRQFRFRVSDTWFQRFKHLTNSDYGARLDDHVDVLWMVTADAEDWRTRRTRMSARMRYSARHAEEVLQAAATQVVFDECDAILSSLRK